MQEETAAFPGSWGKLRLPDEFAKLLDGREPREVTLREAGGGRRQWDAEAVFDGEGHVYLERGWEPFARAHGLTMGNVLVFCYDGDAVLAVKVFDVSMSSGKYQHVHANMGSDNSIDSSSSSLEIGMEDAPTSQFTVTLKKCHSGVRQQQQYPNAHGYGDRSKVSLRMPGNLKQNILLATLALVICIMATPATAWQRSDAWQQISDVNDPTVLEIARWAVAQHASQANDGLRFDRVVSGMEQLVEGKNYDLRIDAVNGGDKECIYTAHVYDIPWLNQRTLRSFALGDMGTCRLVSHPAPPPKSKAPQIKPCFLAFLTSCISFLFI